MFHIITKKDKRIKELEDRLNGMYYKHPMIIQNEHNIIALGAKAIIEHDYIPTDFYKHEIEEKMMQELGKHIHYDIEDFEGKKVITGYLRVISKEA